MGGEKAKESGSKNDASRPRGKGGKGIKSGRGGKGGKGGKGVASSQDAKGAVGKGSQRPDAKKAPAGGSAGVRLSPSGGGGGGASNKARDTESWADREERKAGEAYGKQVARKADQFEQRRVASEAAAVQAAAAKAEASKLRRRGREDDDGTSLKPGAGFAPWANPFGPDDGDDGEAALGALLKHARTKFNVKEVRSLDFVGGYVFEELPKLGLPEVAFLGRSNVGKSSMLNALAGPGQKPALVSKMPGRTRRINLFKAADKQGPFLCVADLPGYGFAKISKAGQASIEDFLNKYLSGRRELALVCLLVDCRLPAQPLDQEVLEAFRSLGLPHLVVATKVDKLKPAEVGPALAVLRDGLELGDSEGPLPFSSSTGEGVREAWGLLRDAALSLVTGGGDDQGEEEEDEEETDEEKIARAGVAWRADEEEVDATARLAPWMPTAN
jgi:GTP-binding protein